MRDALTTRDMNEIADTPAGATQVTSTMADTKKEATGPSHAAGRPTVSNEPHYSIASVQRDGKVSMKPTSSFQEVMT